MPRVHEVKGGGRRDAFRGVGYWRSRVSALQTRRYWSTSDRPVWVSLRNEKTLQTATPFHPQSIGVLENHLAAHKWLESHSIHGTSGSLNVHESQI
jgi:hypothetical protein